MKKTILMSTILIAIAGKLPAQTSKYSTAMETNLKMFDTARSATTFLTLANNFERIGNAEQKQWLPYYYASFCYASMASNSPDKSKVDLLEEKAESYLTLAEAIEKNNSEISTLRGMILLTKLSVDPMGRWQAMGPGALALLAKAKEQNPANPRPYLIEANAKLRMPEGLGGGAKAAKAAIEESISKFNSFVPESPLAPNWGKESATKLLQQINGN